MSISTSNPTVPGIQPSLVSPLRDGDRLTRAEFERRFNAMPNLKRAELLEGVVYMAPPVSQTDHSGPHVYLVTWMGTYCSLTPGVEAGDNGSLKLDSGNMPQPDGFIYIENRCGGQAKIDGDGYVEGGPEFVAEVSASTADRDLKVKFETYRKHGVREYLVWRVLDRAIDWFVLRNGKYERLPLAEGSYRSEVLPGLWLKPDELLARDLSAVIRTVQAGCDTPEHQTFLQQLATVR